MVKVDKVAKLLFRVNLLSMTVRWSSPGKRKYFGLMETAVYEESVGKENCFRRF